MAEKVRFQRVRPNEAIEYFRSKGYAAPFDRFDWRDIWLEEHARSFVVAKATQDEILKTINEAFDHALSEGTGRKQFIKDLTPKLQALGWWGQQSMVDPKTGETKSVRLGSAHRLRVIYDTNMRTAYAAGRWERIQRVKKTFPYLQYNQVDRPTKREEHQRFDGLILPVDDPIWLIIFPPNGWFCGCSTRSLNVRMMKRMGLEVSPPFDLDELPWENKRTGEIEQIPRGVDPGFNSNPGAAWMNIKDRHAATLLDLPGEFIALDRGLTTEIRRLGIQNLDESLVMYDLDADPFDAIIGMSRSLSDINKASRSSVRPTKKMFEAISDPKRKIVAIHNHPNSGSFSGADIGMILSYRGMNNLVAIGADGSIYRLQVIGRGLALADDLNRIKTLVDAAIKAAVELGEISLLEANQLHAHIYMQAYARKGLLNYSAALSGNQADMVARNSALIEAIIGLALK